MEVVVAVVAALTSLLIYSLRCLLSWKLGKKALENNASIKIGGLNPLAPSVEINSHTPPRARGTSRSSNSDLTRQRGLATRAGRGAQPDQPTIPADSPSEI